MNKRILAMLLVALMFVQMIPAAFATSVSSAPISLFAARSNPYILLVGNSSGYNSSELIKDGTEQLYMQLSTEENSDISPDQYEFSSADESIATVDANGLVTGKETGTTSVTVKAKIGGSVVAEASQTIHVADSPTEFQDLTGQNYIPVNGSTTLEAKLNKQNVGVNWAIVSGQSYISLSVDPNDSLKAAVTGLKPGTAVIRATSADNKTSRDFTITVVTSELKNVQVYLFNTINQMDTDSISLPQNGTVFELDQFAENYVSVTANSNRGNVNKGQNQANVGSYSYISVVRHSTQAPSDGAFVYNSEKYRDNEEITKIKVEANGSIYVYTNTNKWVLFDPSQHMIVFYYDAIMNDFEYEGDPDGKDLVFNDASIVTTITDWPYAQHSGDSWLVDILIWDCTVSVENGNRIVTKKSGSPLYEYPGLKFYLGSTEGKAGYCHGTEIGAISFDASRSPYDVVQVVVDGGTPAIAGGNNVTGDTVHRPNYCVWTGLGRQNITWEASATTDTAEVTSLTCMKPENDNKRTVELYVTRGVYHVTYDWGYTENAPDVPQDLNETGNQYDRVPDYPVQVTSAMHDRAGYKFVGWKTNIPGDNNLYQGGNSFIMPNHDVHLTAIWEPLLTVSGTKTWDDTNDYSFVNRPGSIQITLYADGEKVTRDAHNNLVSPKTVTEADGWAWAFTNLPKYKDNKLIKYSFVETAVNGYTASYAPGYVTASGSDSIEEKAIEVTNTLDKINISVTKVWDDENNHDGFRPDTITFNLLANEVNVASCEVGNGGIWTCEFKGLPKYKNGAVVTYSVEEVDPNGKIPPEETNRYKTTGTDKTITATTIENGDTGEIVVTNQYTPPKIQITGQKEWDDDDNRDGIRPSSINITLVGEIEGKADPVYSKTIEVMPNKDDNWTWKFDDLYKYEAGKRIEYSIIEGSIPVDSEWLADNEGEIGYLEPIYSEYDVKNTHEPVKISVSGTKTWDDADDQDGIRPDSITISLYADGSPATDADGKPVPEKTVAEEDNWSWTFDNLFKYNEGKEIVYTVEETEIDVDADWQKENPISAGYEISYSDDKLSEVINTHEPVKISISGTKYWDDANDQDGLRPESITIRLHADGVEIDSRIVTEDANGNWMWSFNDLPKYNKGKKIEYTITEDDIVIQPRFVGEEGYNEPVIGTVENAYAVENTVTNTHIPAVTSVTVTKVWADAEDMKDIRPDSVTINLLADGVVAQSVVLSAENSWTHTFENVPVYSAGVPIAYTVEELKVDGYYAAKIEDVSEVSAYPAKTFVVTNAIEQEYVDVTGTKTWIDPVGTEHAPITVNLLRDGIEIAEAVLQNGETTYSFTGLPKFAVDCEELAGYTGALDGHLFQYSVIEDIVPGYTAVVNGYDIVNTIEQEWIPVTVNKIWIDEEKNTKHPTITIHLLQNGERIQTVKLADGETSYTFENLPKYNLSDGQIYEYTVEEDRVKGYSTKIEGLTITNTEKEDSKIVTIAGRKVWEDNGVEHNNAEEVIITLMRKVDGGEYETVTDVQISWEGNTFYFRNLPRYDEAGKEYEYTFTETPVEGYETVYNGRTIINRKVYEVLNTELSGQKHWIDNDNADGMRPESVVVHLLRDGQLIDTMTVTEANGWAYIFSNLPDNDGHGHYYTYTVTEQMVPGYYLKVEGNDLYNTRIQEEEETELFNRMREEELEELLTIFDYGVPLWGGLLSTGDEIPAYPFVLGGMGLLALVAYVVLNNKRKRT